MKSIVLLTSGQPSTNPRLVKEADALAASGYKVTVIHQFRTEWATVLDEEMLKGKDWQSICIGGSPTRGKLEYFMTRLIHKISKSLVKWLGNRYLISELALGRCTLILAKKASSIKADIYIAHTLGALPAAVRAAEKNNSQCGFDAEDFHRNENSDDPLNLDVLLATYIEDKYIKYLGYFSAASPLISKAYKELYPFLNPITLLNVFPRQHLQQGLKANNKLKLFWFSQTIGFNRGLEEVMEAMGNLKGNLIELHLLGSMTVPTKLAFEKFAKETGVDNTMIFFYPPIKASEIFQFAAQFDVGLATEIGVPKNRDLCLTNKIFTYIQAGIATVASDTSAQVKLLSEFKNMGMIYQRARIKTLQDIFTIYLNENSLLREHKIKSKNYADETLNWEREQDKFLKLISDVIG